MSTELPQCRTITIMGFRGDRSLAYTAKLLQACDEVKKGRGLGPSFQNCLLYAGHVGISLDGNKFIYAFNPDAGNMTAWALMDGLKNGNAYPGVVRDDTKVFAAAELHGLSVFAFDIVLPSPQFQTFCQQLDSERQGSQYLYGFPNGDGDCNCITWLERLGLPLLTGRMDEFARLSGVASQWDRRFGKCS